MSNLHSNRIEPVYQYKKLGNVVNVVCNDYLVAKVAKQTTSDKVNVNFKHALYASDMLKIINTSTLLLGAKR